MHITATTPFLTKIDKKCSNFGFCTRLYTRAEPKIWALWAKKGWLLVKIDWHDAHRNKITTFSSNFPYFTNLKKKIGKNVLLCVIRAHNTKSLLVCCNGEIVWTNLQCWWLCIIKIKEDRLSIARDLKKL